MKTIFTFDLERGYEPLDIVKYREIIQRLSSTYPWNFEIRQETIKNTHEDWIKLQKDCYLDYRDCYSIYTPRLNSYEKYLLIFFEMPDKIREMCIAHNIKYLNFMVSKIRFPGLENTIMVESNLDIGPSISDEELKGYIPEFYKINRYKTPYTHIYPRFEGKTIALGQMYGDRTVIFDGKSHSVLDYDFQADIFRPHPLKKLCQPVKYQEEVSLAKAKGLEVIEEGNIYQILHSCKKVIGISSSTLYEAELMGKEVDFLGEKEYIRNAKILWWKDIDQKFWEHIRSQV